MFVNLYLFIKINHLITEMVFFFLLQLQMYGISAISDDIPLKSKTLGSTGPGY